jgi:hypothetical protein
MTTTGSLRLIEAIEAAALKRAAILGLPDA